MCAPISALLKPSGDVVALSDNPICDRWRIPPPTCPVDISFFTIKCKSTLCKRRCKSEMRYAIKHVKIRQNGEITCKKSIGVFILLKIIKIKQIKSCFSTVFYLFFNACIAYHTRILSEYIIVFTTKYFVIISYRPAVFLVDFTPPDFLFIQMETR